MPTTAITAPSTSLDQAARARSARVLLLEPDADLARELTEQLSADDLDVVTADSATLAASRLRSREPDVAIIHAEQPGTSGYALIDALRAAGSVPEHCPVIAISERSAPADRLRALNRGCVDFLALPLFYPELHARIGLALTRSPLHAARARGLEVRGGLRIDIVGHTATVHGQPVQLSAKEWDLLLLLAAEPERLFLKRELLQRIWGHGDAARTRTLDSHACRLRKLLRAAGGDYVHNTWGQGYRLTAPAPFTD